MRIEKWLKKNTVSLVGKTVAVTGSTGGLGREICHYLARLGADLILVDRNRERSQAHRAAILSEYPEREVLCVSADMENMESVRAATEELARLQPDVLVLNAGAYSIPRKICDTGYGNVFQIHFVSPYYMVRELLPTLRQKRGRVVAVGSIAHNYSKTDPDDVDFSTRQAASRVYGNAKRYLMFSLFELFREETDVSLSVVHPGITFTNITAHYPKIVFAIIKHPMKVIFMKPRHAALSIVWGLFESTEYHTWIGPRLFDVWGLPSKKRLRTVSERESREIFERAEKIYRSL